LTRELRRVAALGFGHDGEPNGFPGRIRFGHDATIHCQGFDDLQAAAGRLDRFRGTDNGSAGTAVGHRDPNQLGRLINRDREVGSGVAHRVGRELRHHHGNRVGELRLETVNRVEREAARGADRCGFVGKTALGAHGAT